MRHNLPSTSPSPEYISKVLRRQPNHAGIKGGRRGASRSRAVWHQNYWCADFDTKTVPADAIASVARFLDNRKVEMLSLLQSGGRAEIYAFLAPESKTVGLELEPSLLIIVGQAGVKLTLEIVPALKR